MRSIALAAVWLLVAAGQVMAHDHHALIRKHVHHRRHPLVHPSHAETGITKRAGQCEFPKDAGLVAVDPEGMNAGWAMSPDQPCKPGMYCPYACPPGQLMAQWNPEATTYTYPESMDGGLYCNEYGEIEKPFPNKPYCYDGTGTVTCQNKANKSVAFCQTVLPGNEAMLIPTEVETSAVLAVPDTSYWAKTAAHYYVNPPGVSTVDACVWGTKDQPVGNWAPYVAGANSVNGKTFVTVGWNPIYIEPDVAFRDVLPDYGVRIECDGPCTGLPCEIDPNVQGVNEVSQNTPAGAGGAHFCVVGVPQGSTATIVVFNKDGSDSEEISIDSNDNDGSDKESANDEEPEQKDETTTSSTYVVPTTSASPTPTTSSSSTSTSLFTSTSSSTSSSSITSSSSSSSSAAAEPTSTSSEEASSTASSESQYGNSGTASTGLYAGTTLYTTSKFGYVASAAGGSYSAAPTGYFNGTNGTSTGGVPFSYEPTSAGALMSFPAAALLMTLAIMLLL